MESVVFHPIPAMEMKTAQEAKHWGAVYALHRVRLALSPSHTFPRRWIVAD
jgi:hypothetical protein